MTYLDLINGIYTRVRAIAISTGIVDADKIARTSSDGRFHLSLMPLGLEKELVSIATSETLASGDLVHIWDNAGTPAVRKADATATNKFRAFGIVKDNYTHPSVADVYLTGAVSGYSGLTIAVPYFLSETPGLLTTTAPTTAEAIVQKIGESLSSTEIDLEIQQPVTLAPSL